MERASRTRDNELSLLECPKLCRRQVFAENARTRAFMMGCSVAGGTMRTRAVASLSLLAALIFAGCFQVGPSGRVDTKGTSGALDRPTVVALIDSGVNPYHVAFTTQHNISQEIERLGVQASVVTLSNTGNLSERKDRDGDFWNSV